MSFITQKGATGALAIQANGAYPTSSDASLNFLAGTRWDLSDGREVMLVTNGATAIASAGVLLQDAPIISGHQGLVVSAFTAYSANGNVPASVTVTLGAANVNANQYQNGFALVDSGPGVGQSLKILSNSAGLASATGVTITLEDGPNTALTTSSTVCLLPPHGTNVVLFPTTATGAAVGVTLYPLAAGQAAQGTAATLTVGFAVTKGVTAVLSEVSAASVGNAVTYSTVTPGAIAGANGSGAVIGYAAQTAVSAKARAVFVNL